MEPRRSLAERAYQLLLRLFPSEFRGDFADEMIADFNDQQNDARHFGWLGVARLW